MLKRPFTTLFAFSLALVLVAPQSPAASASNPVQKGEMTGYLLVPNEKVSETYNAGFSMSYNKKALWDAVKTWFDGGAEASGATHPEGAILHQFTGKGGATWRIYPDGTPKEEKAPLAWNSFATPMAAFRAMSYLTVAVELDHGHVVSKGAESLPIKASGFLTILDPTPLPHPRPIGLARGQFTVPDDFNAPLPEDILQSFEGK